MPAVILAINAGSSSLKVSAYLTKESEDIDSSLLAHAELDGITSPPATFKYERGSKSVKGQEVQGIDSQDQAFQHVLKVLIEDDGLSEIQSKDDIQYTCHRIVHGGDYPKIHVIDSSTLHHLDDLSDLAPLHNASGLSIVRTVIDSLPKATNMANFDTSFHASIPRHISTYAIDQAKAEQNKLRKYGFHGISYAYITKAVAKYLRRDASNLNIIALHLGSGASTCAIKDGKSLDTSMGLTPASGLPGGTRSGDIDPSLVFHYSHDAGKPSRSSTKDMHITRAEEILNKQSGFKGLTGTTDFGEIAASTDPACKLAFDLFVDRILNYVGSYYVKLGGHVDALVFAGGIGEKADTLREAVVDGLDCLGFSIDKSKNKNPEEEEAIFNITRSGARHQTLICQTNEQLEMTRGCIEEIKALRSSKK